MFSIACAYLCVPLQIPLASDNTQFESHWENMPPSSRDFYVPSGLQDPHYTNMVSHGTVDNYSLPPGRRDVSNFCLSGGRLPLNRK